MDPSEVKYEAPLTKHLFRKATSRGVPLSGTIEVSPVCNFNCRMCYVRKSPQEVAAGERRMLEVGDWLRIAAQARDAGALYMLITGGEPFLWPGFRTLYEELVRSGFLVTVNTNGSLIDKDTVEWLKKLPPVRLNITLYGASDETYGRLCRSPQGFTKTAAAVDMLRAAGIPVKLNCSLTPENAEDLEAMIAFAGERDLIIEVNTYMFPPVRRCGSGKTEDFERFTPEEAAYYHIKRYRLQYGEERYADFLAGLRDGCARIEGLDEYCTDPLDGKVSCRAGKAAWWITYDGLMTPCGMMDRPSVDITKDSFAACWEKLREETEKLRLSGVCQRCESRSVCHSCAAMAYAETGTTEGIPRYLCKMTEEMQRLAAEYLRAKEL